MWQVAVPEHGPLSLIGMRTFTAPGRNFAPDPGKQANLTKVCNSALRCKRQANKPAR